MAGLQIQVPQATVAAALPPGSGEIDPPVTADEEALVFDMLEQFDAPSSEEVALEDLGKPAAAAPAVEVAPPVVQVPPQGVQPAAVQAPPSGAPALAPAVQTQGQPQVQPVGTQPLPVQAAPEQVFETLRAKVEQNREVLVDTLAKHYQSTFTADDIEEFREKPEVGLAKMAARLHTDIVQNSLSMLSAQLPVMIHGLISASTQQRTAEDNFYGTYKQFDRTAHGPTIAAVSRTVRQLNPNMPAEQIVPLIAAASAATLGLQGQPAPVVSPAVTARKPVRSTGFAPASSNNGTAQRAVQPTDNQWGMIDMILQHDEAGGFER